MLRNKYIRWSLKIISAVVSFLMIFFFIQPFFIPKYYGDSSSIVKGYYLLEKNQLDVLFLGPSQMFCSVDAGKLTDEYGVNSYDFGASSQKMAMTEYYYYEAIKTQHPKVVMLEVSAVFSSSDSVEKEALSWNFDPMPISFSKFKAAYQVCDHDVTKAIKYSYAPLILYHDRWSSIEKSDIDYVIRPEVLIDNTSRGYLRRDHIESHEIEYFSDDVSQLSIPEENKKAILSIAEDCRDNDIKFVLFKVPVSNWTKGKSQSVKSFSKENNIEFIDLNEIIEELGIDGNVDFYDSSHLNNSGAEKTTDYLAKILPSLIVD